MRFYRVSHNSFHCRGFPWATRIVDGLSEGKPCQTCGAVPIRLARRLQLLLDPKKGSSWPDVLGCGAYPLFIVSRRAMEALATESLGEYPHGEVHIVGELPAKLRGTSPEKYFWLDGKRMQGALLDFDASGFVGVQFCPACGNRTDDISRTYDRQRTQVWPYVFKEGTWRKTMLFTTDLSPSAFFCTEELVEIARKYRLTNFRFTPVEEGKATESKGLRYLEG